MSDSERPRAEADSSTPQDVKKEKEAAAPAPSSGDSSNGLSAQLEEKIIRQVEVSFWFYHLTTWLPSSLLHFFSFILETGICQGTSFSNPQCPRVMEDVSLIVGVGTKYEGGVVSWLKDVP